MLTPDTDITFTNLCFRKQKNNDNGQTLTYRRRADSHWLCPTQASLNIVRRARRLNSPPHSPAAVYRDSTTGKRRLITASQVAIFLRHVAHKVFDLPTGHKDCLHGPAIPFASRPPTSSIALGSLIHTSKTASGGAATPSSCICATHFT